MPRRTQIRAKLVSAGVDIIDHNGEMLCGITNRDAIDLLLSLSRQSGRIIHGNWLDAGKPIRGKLTAKVRRTKR